MSHLHDRIPLKLCITMRKSRTNTLSAARGGRDDTSTFAERILTGVLRLAKTQAGGRYACSHDTSP